MYAIYERLSKNQDYDLLTLATTERGAEIIKEAREMYFRDQGLPTYEVKVEPVELEVMA